MNRAQVIFRNILSNWIGFAVQACVVFFLTPYVLTHLGDTRYGVWILITSITGYYGLLALGFQGGVNQYLTRYFSKGDFEKMNRVASTAVAAMSLVGLVVAVASLTLAWLTPKLFNIPPALETEVFWCTFIVGISVAIQLSLFVFSATFMSTQRYDLANLIGISTRLINAALVFGAIHNGFGLVGISLATAISNTVDYVLRWRIAYRILPQLSVSRYQASVHAFHEMFSYGSWSFLIAVSQSVFYHLDSIVIGAMLPIAYLAPYALAAGLVRNLEALLRPIDMVFFPVATQLHARDETDKLRAVYLRGSRIFLVAVAISAVFAGVWAEDFYRLWVGEEYISGSEFPSVALLFQILLFAMVGRLFPGLGAQMLQGTLRVKPLAIIYILEALLNAVLSVLWVKYWGLMGVAFATLVSVVAVRTLSIPIILGGQLGVSLSSYVRQAVLKPVLLAAILYFITIGIRGLGEPVGSFAELAARCVAAALAAAPLALYIGLTRNDREEFVFRLSNDAWNQLVARVVKTRQLSPRPAMPVGRQEILLVTPFELTDIGGVSTAVRMLANEFARKGHQVHVLILGENSWLTTKLDPHVTWHNLFLRKPSHEGAYHRSILMFLVMLPITLWQLARLCKRHDISAVYVQYPLPQFFYFGLLRRVSKWKLIASFQGTDAHQIQKWQGLNRRCLKFLLNSADHVSGVAESLLWKVSDTFPAIELITSVIPNGAMVANCPVQRINNDKTLPSCFIFSAGHLIHRKGFDVLLRGYALASKYCPSVDLVIAGEGDEHESLKELAVSSGVGRKVHFVGWRNDQQMDDLIQRCMFFILTSRAEGLPLVIAEAMMAGKPVIATSIDGVPEIVDDEVNGLLVPTEDSDAVAAAIVRLTSDSDLRAEFARAALETASRGYSWSAIADRYLQIAGINGNTPAATSEPPITIVPVGQEAVPQEP